MSSVVRQEFSDCFPELFGLVLLDPIRLEQFVGSECRGRDLLTRFATTGDGDAILDEGIALPLMDLVATPYSVVICDGRESVDATPDLRSEGWVLGTESGALLLVGAGYLRSWDPGSPAHKHVSVAPGWYQVEVLGYAAEPRFELRLHQRPVRPARRAASGTSFALDVR
jgi:hypothetical protein